MPQIKYFVRVYDDRPFAGTPHAIYSDAELQQLKQAANQAGVRISVRKATEDDQ
ncbi:hypothetical protein [Nonomuraea turcica]|uniref:hypothetical protein n=1 Tax=Nonomuraea sp. G32 TaxID=3067274 RepID=UPI00273B42B3|nr:hypothetical protein [Nonomuraea sp. G32]MDP4501103.1 hypothetical protein [Nonomuraea sp. G32]